MIVRNILNHSPLISSSLRATPSLIQFNTLHITQAQIIKSRVLTSQPQYNFAGSQNKQQWRKQKKYDHKFDASNSYFQVLGVESAASEQEIKGAYLQMVKRYHPDLSKEQDASEKFQLIQKAYQVLSDPEQRGKHRDQQKIVNPQIYTQANQIKQKYKNYKRKQRVPDEWQFSYKLFKKHYQEVDAKKKEYKRFEGQGDQYYVHKDEMKPDRKVYVQQVAMVGGAVGIIAGAFYYMKH